MKDIKIFASCHNHSCFSDAEYTPEQLVALAKEQGHGGFILTDHDTVRGTYFTNKAARKLGMKSILGCEFTTTHNGRGVHFLRVYRPRKFITCLPLRRGQGSVLPIKTTIFNAGKIPDG